MEHGPDARYGADSSDSPLRDDPRTPYDQPRRGDRVTVFWPNGPYDFVVRYESHEDAGRDGWVWLYGHAVNGGGNGRWYVHPVKGGYALLPYTGTVPVSSTKAT